jgi:hypothetical protein
MTKKIKITQDNWNELLNNPPMSFKTFLNGTHVAVKKMKKEGSFATIRYVEPEDVIYAMENRIKNQTNFTNRQTQKQKKKWEEVIQNAQNLLDKQAMMEEQIKIQKSAHDTMKRNI